MFGFRFRIRLRRETADGQPMPRSMSSTSSDKESVVILDDGSDLDEETVVILDNGSHRIQAGYAGDDYPRTVFRTLVGRSLYEGQTINGERIRSHYVGDEAMHHVDVLDVTRPIERGIITNWDDMEKIWQHAFMNVADRHVLPSDHHHPVIVTEPPLNPKANKERIVQMMFEKFHKPAVRMLCSTVLPLCAEGKDTGVVVDSGYELTRVTCFYNGYAIPQSVFRLEFGGNDITIYLIDLLRKQGWVLTTMKEREEVSSLKERCSYVSLEPKLELLDKVKKDYTIFGDNIISVGYERFQCQEAMFKPELMGIGCPGIHEVIMNSIQACPVDLRTRMFRNIILAGCNTKTTGLDERIQKEIAAVVSPWVPVKVVVPQFGRKSCTWIGGSILGSLSWQPTWVTKEEYDEFGPARFHNFP